jgi:poly(A) polymerase
MLKFNPVIPKIEGAYIVGGSVRDLLLERSPSDYDIAVPGPPDKYAFDLARKCNGKVVKIGKLNHSIFRVISGSNIFDISAIEGKSIEDDLKKRDYTINAIGYNVKSEELIDLFEGRRDLYLKKIRMVSNGIFRKDPVRLLRAYRIAAMYGFEIETETATAIAKNAKLIQRSAGERIKSELFKIFSHPESYKYIGQMAGSGLLFEIFPELKALRGCRQNRYHAYDVLDHSFSAYNKLEMLLNEKRIGYGDINLNLPDINSERSAIIKYSILLHDIGKPDSLTIGDDGNIHFFGHEIRGADMAKKISKRLKLSNIESDYADFIIRNHISALNLFNSSGRCAPSKRALTRFFIKCGNKTPDIMLHTIADIMGKGIDDERNVDFLRFASFFLKEFFSGYEVKKTGPRLITGDDLINKFGLKPSPLFKRILSEIEESRISNDIKNRKEAFALAGELIKNYS